MRQMDVRIAWMATRERERYPLSFPFLSVPFSMGGRFTYGIKWVTIGNNVKVYYYYHIL
jgi:hypothetical protein